MGFLMARSYLLTQNGSAGCEPKTHVTSKKIVSFGLASIGVSPDRRCRSRCS
jgi:hypothetical protein